MTNVNLQSLLRCPLCGKPLDLAIDEASCGSHVFPIEGGIPRLLPPDLMDVHKGRMTKDLRARTYRSFGFEWTQFSDQLPAYFENFRWYLEPLPREPLSGRLVLDAGCGMGRHTHHFLAEGARVVALDASPAIEAAARNNSGADAAFVQGDILLLPLAPGSFDLACCLGVLHHIEDTEAGLGGLVRTVRPDGWVLVYLYHDPCEQGVWRGLALSLVTAARTLTTRMPMGLLRMVTGALALGLLLGYIAPLRLLCKLGSIRDRIRGLPLGQYIDYPFRVLWNDQFDRFSAPLEKRFTRAQVEGLLIGAGLVDVRILGGYGWRAAGRRPDTK